MTVRIPSSSRLALLVLLSALMAFAALTPAHANGPCFCLCDWHDLLGTSSGHAGEEGPHCDEDVPLHPCAGHSVALPPADLAGIAISCVHAPGAAQHFAPMRVQGRGGSSAPSPAALSLRI